MSEHIVELNVSQRSELVAWLLSGTGGLVLGRVTFESVAHGGILVRTHPYQAPARARCAPEVTGLRERVDRLVQGQRVADILERQGDDSQ